MSSPNPQHSLYKNKGLTRIIKATGYSARGLQAAWSSEAAFRQECVLASLTLPVISLLDFTSIERVLLVVSTLLVLIVELLNSAIEAAIDRIGMETHTLSAKAKDIGSAAVMVSLGLWGYVWWELILNA